MIKAAGRAGALQLTVDGTPIAVLDDAKLAFSLSGQAYTIRRQGAVTPLYELLRDDEVVVSVQSAALVMRFTVRCAGREWVLKSEGIVRKRFGLFDGGARVGGIISAGLFNYARDITIDLPADLPLEAQVFLMWVLLWKWGAPG